MQSYDPKMKSSTFNRPRQGSPAPKPTQHPDPQQPRPNLNPNPIHQKSSLCSVSQTSSPLYLSQIPPSPSQAPPHNTDPKDQND